MMGAANWCSLSVNILSQKSSFLSSIDYVILQGSHGFYYRLYWIQVLTDKRSELQRAKIEVDISDKRQRLIERSAELDAQQQALQSKLSELMAIVRLCRDESFYCKFRYP